MKSKHKVSKTKEIIKSRMKWKTEKVHFTQASSPWNYPSINCKMLDCVPPWKTAAMVPVIFLRLLILGSLSVIKSLLSKFFLLWPQITVPRKPKKLAYLVARIHHHHILFYLMNNQYLWAWTNEAWILNISCYIGIQQVQNMPQLEDWIWNLCFKSRQPL